MAKHTPKEITRNSRSGQFSLRFSTYFAAVAILLTSVLMSGISYAQASPEKGLRSVRDSVVRIMVHAHDQGVPLPPEVENTHCFNASHCIVGTGVFVDSQGDVLTAAHVAIAVQRLEQALTAHQIGSHLEVGVSVPNTDTSPTQHIHSSGNSLDFQSQVIAIDQEHDLALIRTDGNPFTVRPPTSPHGYDLPQPKPKVARFSVQRPKETEPVFACGFPLSEMSLITTTGTVASAWDSEVPLLIRTQQPAARPIDIFKLDLRINPGNSGGPVFRSHDHTLIGIVIEIIGPSPLANAVPAKYAVAFLKRNGITATVVP